MGNKNLHRAKKAKNDEFYTLYDDIKKEVEHYYKYDKDVFRGKTILLPCDNPEHSNFTLYFFDNFERFGIKKLISTSYAEGANADIFSLHKVERKGRVFIYEGKEKLDKPTWEFLNGYGDFRSEEVTAFRDEADFIITNPPFSLFREFIDWVEVEKRGCLILGNINAITYQNVFPFIKDGALTLGKDTKPKQFIADNDLISVPSYWYTNIKFEDNVPFLDLKTQKENEIIMGKPYQKFDNYNAINVPKVSLIPSDYKGIMGVPITFLEGFNSKQFEILGAAKTPICFSNDVDAKRTKVYKNAVQYKNNKIVGGGAIK